MVEYIRGFFTEIPGVYGRIHCGSKGGVIGKVIVKGIGGFNGTRLIVSLCLAPVFMEICFTVRFLLSVLTAELHVFIFWFVKRPGRDVPCSRFRRDNRELLAFQNE